jgi:hypothetical protein
MRINIGYFCQLLTDNAFGFLFLTSNTEIWPS